MHHRIFYICASFSTQVRLSTFRNDGFPPVRVLSGPRTRPRCYIVSIFDHRSSESGETALAGTDPLRTRETFDRVCPTMMTPWVSTSIG